MQLKDVTLFLFVALFTIDSWLTGAGISRFNLTEFNPLPKLLFSHFGWQFGLILFYFSVAIIFYLLIYELVYKRMPEDYYFLTMGIACGMYIATLFFNLIHLLMTLK